MNTKDTEKHLVDYTCESFDLLERVQREMAPLTPERQKILVDIDKFLNRFKRYKNSLATSEKYKCEVEFTCVRLNCMRSLVESHLQHNPGVQKNILDYIESVRKDNNNLRSWGHDLRIKLIEKETIK